MVEFNEENHIYKVDGNIVPSVTQLLHFLFPNKYKGVPAEVLSNKANYGTEIHSLIEKVNDMNITDPLDAYSLEYSDGLMINSITNYINVKNKYKFKPIAQELMVYNKYLAGRFDLISEMNNKICLMDIKTTYILDREYLSWQLSIYNYLNKEIKAEELYAIWVPKNNDVQLIKIKFKSDKEIINLIMTYYLEEKNMRIIL